jgi:aspartate racemase
MNSTPTNSILTLSTEEERRLLFEWNQNQQDFPQDKCLHELVAARAEAAPEHLALICGSRQLTYGEFNARSNQWARLLRDHGVGPDVKVGICLRPEIDFAIAILAVMKAGGACVPLDPNYPKERLAYMVEDVQAPVLITSTDLGLDKAPEGCQVLLVEDTIDALSHYSTATPENQVTPYDIAYVIYTSGSTGAPRGVLLPHIGLVNYLTTMSRYYAVTPQDRVLQFCSVSFDIAIEELFTAWTSGATLVLRDQMPLAVPEFLQWIERFGVTILDLPTAYWHEWVHHFNELKAPVPASVRLVIIGGERATSKAYKAWANTVGNRVRVVNTYGPTEGSISVTVSEPSYQDADAVPESVPIGRPVANCRIYILTPDLKPVPVGTPGELHLAGVCVAKGYYNRPELTSQKFVPDPFASEPNARMYKTGDMARFLPSGDIEFLGRTDDQVKIRGFRVELGEIEAILHKYPGVREIAVIAREDEPGEKRLIGYFVVDKNAEVSTSDVRRYLHEHLPEYMVPSDFVVLDVMPLTPNGKINRRGLPAPVAPVATTQPVEAASDLQNRLLKIWENVIGRKPIGIHDNFFELGGHSLMAARLMHRIGQELGKTLPLAMLFESPTVERLAAALEQDGWSHHWSSLVRIQTSGSNPPFFMVHGVGGNVVGFRELGLRMAPDFPFYGLQSQGLDGKEPCLKTIPDMAHHYLGLMRSVQAEGPYFLGGFSLGGLIAYEIAQQLCAMGEQVALLTLFDTYPGDPEPVSKAGLLKLLLTPSWQGWFHDIPKKVRKRIKRKIRAKFQNVPEYLRQIRRSNAAAADAYVLEPYAGKAILIRAKEKSLRSAGDPHAAWYGLVKNLEVRQMPGDHFDMLLAPQVDRLAACLKECIEQSRAQFEGDRNCVKVS